MITTVPFADEEGDFLSCLCGSDHVINALKSSIDFLSCLCGSDHKPLDVFISSDFLSCLCGSDQKMLANIAEYNISKLPMRQ